MLHWKIIVSHLKSIPIHSQMLISSCKLATQSSKLKMYPGNDSDCTIRIVSKHLLSFFPVVYHASIHNGGHDLLNCMLGPIWACSLPELHICWFPNMLWTMITFYLHCSAHFIANYYIITFFYLKACQSFIKWPCSSCFFMNNVCCRWLFNNGEEDALSELQKLNSPSQICGHVFKAGEATFTCR